MASLNAYLFLNIGSAISGSVCGIVAAIILIGN